MQKVVIDTNVIVSAALSPAGNPAKIVNMIFDGEVQAYFCMEILVEYEEVLSRPEFNHKIEKRKTFMHNLMQIGVLSEPVTSGFLLPDESDRVFYDTAKGNGAILITGNIKHYPDEEFIMTPTEFISFLAADNFILDRD
ncbi:MAG: putative toxin-antitoxin system toxin component, PIN family [Synergistaceae bacterium]|nr:putative toxin-antitoxin system toxin component, PIN family [Synergistaceae bacterium]